MKNNNKSRLHSPKSIINGEYISTSYDIPIKYIYIANSNEQYLREDGWLT